MFEKIEKVLIVMVGLAGATACFGADWKLIDNFNGDLSAWSDQSVSPGTAKIAKGAGPDGSGALELDMRAKATGKLAKIALNNSPQIGTNDTLMVAFDMRVDPLALKSYSSGMIFAGIPDTVRIEQNGKSGWSSASCGVFDINTNLQKKNEKGDRRKQVGKWYHYVVKMTLEDSSVKVFDWVSADPADYAGAKPVWKGTVSDVVGNENGVLQLHNNSAGAPDSYAQNRGLSRFDNIYYRVISGDSVGGISNSDRFSSQGATPAPEISIDDMSVRINSRTGAVSSIRLGEVDVLNATQEVWSFENREGRKFIADTKRNKVNKVNKSKNSVILTMTNSMLKKKDVGISVKYFQEEGLLIKRVELQNNSKEDLVVRAYSKTWVADTFMQDGIYYVPEGEYSVPAKEIKMTRKIDNMMNPTRGNQMMSMYNSRSDILAASFIYRVNDKFTTFMAGCSVPLYLKGGWSFSAAHDYLRPGAKTSYEIAYYITSGSPSKLMRRWLSLQDIRRFRAEAWKNTKVPKWLKDTSLIGFVYTPSQVRVKKFIPNLKPLADKIPGKMLVMQWGASQRALPVKGYGQPYPPQVEDILWAMNDLKKIREEMPNVKMGNYRYYWALDSGSAEGLAHPEWRQYDRSGKTIFSGTPNRYARQAKIPAARKYCADSTHDWYRYVPMDFHYVDGTDGGYPPWIDWKHRMCAQWYDWHLLFMSVYNIIHHSDISTGFLFCNYYPVAAGDSGFVEIGANITRVWQSEDGWKLLADRCEIGKNGGPPQGIMGLLFWVKNNDLRYINHFLAYGLVPNLAPGGSRYTGSQGLDFCLPRVPYVKAEYEIRNSKLVYPELKPDWRADCGTTEAIMMQTGSSYRLNVINHDEKSKEIELSFNPSKIGLAGKEIELSQLELVPPKNLIATKSHKVFKVVRAWKKRLPEKGRCAIKVKLASKLLNSIVMNAVAVDK